MAKARVTLEVGNDGVGIITFSHPPVNALSPAIFAGLREKFEEAMQRDDVKAVVLTGDHGRFSGGFDINVFEQIHKTGDDSVLPDADLEPISNVMEDAKKPSVAAIQGLALGGGLELALGCHARICTPETTLGLPELTLGVIPGGGGTQRLPRLIGLSKAIELMLLSKTISAMEGKSLGLIDATVSHSELLDVSRLWALDIASRRKPWISSLLRTDRLDTLSEARGVIKMARQQANHIAPNMPQHHACLDAIEEGILFGGRSGLSKEARIFKELVVSSTSKSLVHVFFAQRAVSKVPHVTDVGIKPRRINKAAVIGGGLMGSGIATALIRSNISVLLKEIDSAYLQKAIRIVAANLDGLVKKGAISQEKKGHSLSLLKGVLDYSDFGDVDLVIEAAVEKVPLKQSIFSEIEKVCPRHCILATNTSTIDLNVVGSKTSSQDRIIGAHFFSPAHVMPLLEIVRTEKTSSQVIIDLMAVGKAIKKVPVVVGNCTGFAVNRTFFPYAQAATILVDLGVDIFRIDKVITGFGIPVGPFQLQDMAGYGVALAVRDIYASAFKGRTYQSALVELMIESGRHGKSNGKGYYNYEKGMKPKPDLSIQPIIEESRRRANIMPSGKPVTLSDGEILEIILFPVINEACRVMDEGVVVRASDLDIASVLGMSFPKYRGGLIFWADSVGAGHIYGTLRKLEQLYGGFFKPSSYLEERAKNSIPLSAISSMMSHGSRARL